MIKRIPLIAIALILLGLDPCLAQDPVEVGKQELNNRNFPWYEKETGNIADLNRPSRQKAKTLDRNNLSTRTITKRGTGNNVNFDGSWFRAFSGFVWILIGLAGLAIAALIVWVFLQLESQSNPASDSHLDEEEAIRQRIKQLPFQLDQNHKGDFRTMAAAAAQAGDYGRATMLLFSHVLLTLDKKKLIQLKRGKTNRQYLNELKRHTPLRQFYEKIMVPFEDNFFGNHEIAQPVFEDCWQALDTFHADVVECSEFVDVGVA